MAKISNAIVVCCVSAKLEMESYAALTSPCYSTPILYFARGGGGGVMLAR